MKTARAIGTIALVLAAMTVTACAGGGGGDAMAPIPVGAIASLSGPSTFPESTQAAKAVFDRFNAAGGLDGRKIEYTVVDDKADPGTSGSAARELVGNDGVVALVGSASLLECQINAKYYEQEKVASVEGVAVDPGCFASSMIAPVNVGPYGDTELSLRYGSETLGLQRICALIETAGSTAPAYEKAVERWKQSTGKSLAYFDDTLPYGASDYTPYVVKAKAQHCDGVLIGLIEPDALGFLKAAQAQGWSDVTYLSLTTVYTDAFAKAAGGMVGKGLYVPAEFAPFTDPSSAATKDWRDLMTKEGIPLTSFGQAGYLAATDFLAVLKTIKGDVTRESVLAALQAAQPVENEMTGSPWRFASASNRSGWPVKLSPGSAQWETAGSDWIRLDG